MSREIEEIDKALDNYCIEAMERHMRRVIEEGAIVRAVNKLREEKSIEGRREK